MKHFVHYLTREITPWEESKEPFFEQDQDPDAGFDRPMFHITRQESGAVTAVEPGSVIWLFSVLESPWGRLPPSLDAKIAVEKIEKLSDGRTKFHADESSLWFPLFNATEILHNLSTAAKDESTNKLWKDPDKPLGLYLQSMRQLTSGDVLMKYSDTVAHSKFDFISYRICDGTEPAFATAKNLVDHGKAVFWDRYSLPRRLVERREHVSDKKLDDFLLRKIDDANQVFGVETPKYSEENCYAQKEADAARHLNKYVAVGGF